MSGRSSFSCLRANMLVRPGFDVIERCCHRTLRYQRLRQSQRLGTQFRRQKLLRSHYRAGHRALARSLDDVSGLGAKKIEMTRSRRRSYISNKLPTPGPPNQTHCIFKNSKAAINARSRSNSGQSRRSQVVYATSFMC